MKNILAFIIFISAVQVFGQYSSRDILIKKQKLKVAGDYKHKSTEFVFPDTLSIGYYRLEIASVNHEGTAIYAEYMDGWRNKIDILVYPGGLPSANRLSNAFKLDGVDPKMYYKLYKRYKLDFKTRSVDEFELLGVQRYFNATFPCLVEYYECGEWMFRLNIQPMENKKSEIFNLKTQLLDEFKPEKLIENHSLEVSFHTSVSKVLFKDSVLLAGALNADGAYIMWFLNNVSKKALSGGVPGYFMEAHLVAIDSALHFIENYPHPKTEYAEYYFGVLKSIKDAGFLREYVMEQNQYFIYLDDHSDLDFKGYKKWKRKNDTEIDYILNFFTNHFLPKEEPD